jgi:hypothetical protein
MIVLPFAQWASYISAAGLDVTAGIVPGTEKQVVHQRADLRAALVADQLINA